MFRTQIEIFTPRSFGRIPRHPEDGYMAEDVTESIIHQISEEKLIKRVQISDYIPNTVLEKLNRLFILRPDISFRHKLFEEILVGIIHGNQASFFFPKILNIRKF